MSHEGKKLQYARAEKLLRRANDILDHVTRECEKLTEQRKKAA